MDAGTWIAIAAAAVALAALYYTARATRAGEEQTGIQRQLRIDAAQPYVWADVRPDDATGVLLNLVVGNSGPTVATRVRVAIDPPLPFIGELRGRAEPAQRRLAEGISSLPPGRSLTWPLGQGFNLIKDDGPQAHTFTVTAEGPFGAVPPLTYTVDLADYRGAMHRPSGNLHVLSQAITELAGKIGQRQPPDI